MISRLLKMQSVGDDDEFFASVSTAIAASPTYVRPCFSSQCDLVPLTQDNPACVCACVSTLHTVST